MAYTIPPFETIRAAWLRDLQNLDDTAHVAGDSDNFVRASATASAADGLYHHQSWIARQILPDTADPENIERHAALRGLSLKPATRAAGTLVLTVSGGVLPFAAGLTVTHPVTNESFITTEEFSGSVTNGNRISLTCAAGRAGRMPEYTDEPVVLANTPPGILPGAALTLRGGTERETHAELLVRLLFFMRNPPGGGTASDYERWAMEVPGVSWARCHPRRRGIGTVDVVVTSDEGLPSPEILAAVQAALDAKRPVTCPDCLVLSPVPLAVDVKARIRTEANTPHMLRPRVETALARYFSGLLPGDPALASRILAVILDVPGIFDAQLVAPQSNTIAEPLRWPRFGALTLESL